MPRGGRCRRSGVVLVDDRNHPQFQKPVQRPLRVAVVVPSHHVVGGEQHLTHHEVPFAECLRVLGDQRSLPHTGRSLLGGEVLGAMAQPQRAHGAGHGARGDDDDLAALGHDIRDDADNGRDGGGIEVAAGGCQ